MGLRYLLCFSLSWASKFHFLKQFPRKIVFLDIKGKKGLYNGGFVKKLLFSVNSSIYRDHRASRSHSSLLCSSGIWKKHHDYKVITVLLTDLRSYSLSLPLLDGLWRSIATALLCMSQVCCLVSEKFQDEKVGRHCTTVINKSVLNEETQHCFNNLIHSKVSFINSELNSQEIVPCKVSLSSNKLPDTYKTTIRRHADTTAYQCVKKNFHAILYRNTKTIIT